MGYTLLQGKGLQVKKKGKLIMSFIYVAESGKGFCKVGKTNNPDLRLRSIENEMGIKITNFKYFHCGFGALFAERAFHETLKDFNIFGEWFSLDFNDLSEFVYYELPGLKADFPDEFKEKPKYKSTSDLEPLSLVSKRAEMEHVTLALKNYNGDVAKAARAIGISKASMHRKIRELEINNTITYK